MASAERRKKTMADRIRERPREILSTNMGLHVSEDVRKRIAAILKTAEERERRRAKKR
jgi:hypothetical protein